MEKVTKIKFDTKDIDWTKVNGFIPAIIQDFQSLQILMHGYMNQESLSKTLLGNKVTFFSRTKQRLWTKGETSGNFLILREIHLDCDNDTLLVYVDPTGAVCHTGDISCFKTDTVKLRNLGFLSKLMNIIRERSKNRSESSYISKLFKEGTNKIAQKVGEEAVELVIESIANNKNLFKEEAADLLFHYLILLENKNIQLEDIIDILKGRDKKN